MDSDADLHDTSNTDEEEYYDSDELSVQQQPENYTILTREDILQRQQEDITRISTVLSVSEDHACMLLRHHNWIASKVEEEWFNDEDRVRKVVGLLDRLVVTGSPGLEARGELDCGICFEKYPLDAISTVACGHPFCKTCWTAYISTSINDGPGCLNLRCPEPSCTAAVDVDMVNALASDKDKEKYRAFLLRSYVERSRNIKWCPAPDCQFAVEFDIGSGGNYEVSCLCSYRFCWNCGEEAHSPADCDTVSKWLVKVGSETETKNWILVNSKPCPKCSRPIEKNEGCMHMMCMPPCKFQFCWLCLGEWKNHHLVNGGFYNCNVYTEAQQAGAYDELVRKKEEIRKALERYGHYFERWATNESSRRKATADLHKMDSEYLKKLGETQCQPATRLKFITEAWVQIIECRRVLKWTYAYGYYVPEDDREKKRFFEFLQGEAEAVLERLHGSAEKALRKYFFKGRSNKFSYFRSELTGLTKAAGTYFKNLVRALENDLSEVEKQRVRQKPFWKTFASTERSRGRRRSSKSNKLS